MRSIDALGHLPRRGDRKGRVGQMRNWPVSGSGPAQDHCLRPWHATQQNEWIAERSAARAKKGGCHWGHGQNGFGVNLKGPDGWADGWARLRRARAAPAKEKPPCVLLVGCRKRVQTSSSERADVLFLPPAAGAGGACAGAITPPAGAGAACCTHRAVPRPEQAAPPPSCTLR